MPRFVLTDGQRAEIVGRYRAGESSSSLGRAYGVSSTTVRNVLHRGGVAPRRSRAMLPLRHDALDVLTPEASYWCGFLFAGYAYTDTRIMRNGVRFRPDKMAA